MWGFDANKLEDIEANLEHRLKVFIFEELHGLVFFFNFTLSFGNNWGRIAWVIKLIEWAKLLNSVPRPFEQAPDML